LLPGGTATDVSALSVHLNRGRHRTLEAPASFVADGEFDVAFENHGDGSHVHVQLDEALSGVARVRDDSEFVESGAVGHVRVNTREVEEPVTGELTITVGYGTETASVEVRIEPARAGGYGIDVDERLAEPQSEPSAWPPDAETVALLALAGAALLAAAAVAVTIQSEIVVAAAALVALITVVGVVVALA
jgi:hypothetical protein